MSELKLKIEVGDIVDVDFINRNDKIDDAKVLHIPQATGDMWQFEYDNGTYHSIIYVNPSCSELMCIVKSELIDKNEE